MDWLSKIPSWIKIPIKVLLPALTIFSGLLLFLNDSAIEILNLYNFRKENGSIFGLLFIITLSLEIVYIAYFVYDKIREITIAQRVAKRLLKDNQVELLLLMALYNEPKKSALFPMNDGMIARLEGRKYIAKFSQPIDYTYRVSYFMQPFVEWGIEKIFDMVDKEEKKLTKKISKCKDVKNKEQIKGELIELQQYRVEMKEASISKFYDQTIV